MAKFPDPLPHGDLEEAFPDVFWLQGTVRMAPGMAINRNMVVLRHDGALTVINAVRPNEAGLRALDALGRVENVVKIGLHGMDDAWFVDHYGARMWAPPGVEASVPVDEVLTADGPKPVPWVRTFAFEHVVQPEVALVAHREGGVLLTCDSLQNWPDADGCSALGKLATNLLGFRRRPANIGPPWKRIQTPKGGSLQSDFERLLNEEFDHLIGGHGKPLVGGAHDAVAATVAAVFP